MLICRAINATVGLDSGTSNGSDSAFSVAAHSYNAPLDVRVTSIPVDSRLDLYATNNGAPAHVALHPAFEGAFDLVSLRGGVPRVHLPPDVEDPAGRGRKRVVQMKPVGRNAVRGSVAWGEEFLGKGNVSIKAESGEVSLSLGEGV